MHGLEHSSISRLTQSTWGLPCSSGTWQKHVLCGPLSKVGAQRAIILLKGGSKSSIVRWYLASSFSFQAVFPFWGIHSMGSLFQIVPVSLSLFVHVIFRSFFVGRPVPQIRNTLTDWYRWLQYHSFLWWIVAVGSFWWWWHVDILPTERHWRTCNSRRNAGNLD